jgi:DNA-binding NtrC family response regulator
MAKQKTKILVIDDDPKVAWILSEGLSNKFEFVTARDGMTGLQMVSTEKPDLILLDIKMPGMNGIEVLKEIRMHDPHARVIILTGYADINNAIAAVNNGAYAFFRKPLDFSDFMDTIGIVQKQTESASGLDVDGPLLKERYAELKQAYTKLLWVVKDLDSELKQNEESEKTVRNGGEKKT